MALANGTRLGAYEIVGLVGAGGMGEVYKAHDARLDRTVAIKVLSASWADDADMKQRFEREAHTIASLNHPHICTIHDIGEVPDLSAVASAKADPRSQTPDPLRFLVMEYLDGETLAARIARGALGLTEALKIAIAILDALDRAHRHGVVHRDVKPSNVMLTTTGPKLLDFGLAKRRTGGVAAISGLSALPTGADLTTPGAILGTLQYMAPEQLEGLDADARTDIFAFGALLHEMVTGSKAFQGKSQVQVISAIVTSQPQPLSTVQPATPRALEHVVNTCLAKDPNDRWQSARDLLAELHAIAEGGDEVVATRLVTARHGPRAKLYLGLLGATALLALAMAMPAFRYLRGPGVPDELRFRVPILLNAQQTIVAAGLRNNSGFAVSPDGRQIVFNANSATEPLGSLYVRPVGGLAPQRLAGTEGGILPFWSPDSHWIGFVADGKLKKVEASGGPPQQIADVTGFSGGAWNSEGAILFGTPQGLHRVPAEGGTPAAVTTLGEGETGHFWPAFLPDGRHYLFLVWSGQDATRAIYTGTLDSKEKTRVLAAESNPVYADPGYLLFRRQNAVYAQPFDPSTLALSAAPVRVADEVTFDAATGRGHFTVSRSGVLAYNVNSLPATTGGGGAQSDTGNYQLRWVDRQGQQQDVVGAPGAMRGIEVSPDTRRIAVHRHDAKGGDIFVIEPRGSETRLTFDAAQHNSMPIWSPTGTHIAYASQRNGKWGLYQTLSTGSGAEELLFESDLPKAPMSWSPDGKRIVFWVRDPKTGGDLWVLPTDGDRMPAPFIATPANETHGQISPDGKWLAYTTNSNGGRNEIYVRPFPSGVGTYQVSNNSGAWPRWRHDGKELFYRAGGTEGADRVFPRSLFSAPMNVSGAAFEPGSPRPVLSSLVIDLPHSGGDYSTYAVSPDGQRFLIVQYFAPTGPPIAALGPDPPTGLMIAMNWTSRLEK